MPSLSVPINGHDARSMSPHLGRLSSTSSVVSRRQSNSFTRVAPSHPRRRIAARTSCADTGVKTSFRNTFPGDARNRGAALLTARPTGRVRVNKENEKKKVPNYMVAYSRTCISRLGGLCQSDIFFPWASCMCTYMYCMWSVTPDNNHKDKSRDSEK